MNIIVTNQNKNLIYNANIEIMKELNGVFQVSEIANSFNSIFYKKLIIDATALKDFPKEEMLRRLAKTFDTEKLILFLPPDNPPPKKFLSLLVSLNIYNFTDNVNGLQNLIVKSNTYDDVKEFVVTNSPRSDDNSLDFNDDSIKSSNDKIILGIKNVTKNAGSTELTYMLKKALESVHKREVVALEIDKRDFVFYNEKGMISISNSKLGEFFSSLRNNEIVIVDLGDNNQKYDFCTDVIYLVEPSLYRVNQLMMIDRSAFNSLKGKKVVLNENLLTDNDVNTFAKEAVISLYYTLPPLNDRVFNSVISGLLSKLGLIDVGESDNQKKNKRSFFDIFK